MTEPVPAPGTSVAVWDWPVRLVHWSLVLLISFSWWSAENEEIEWHLWSGLAVLFLLLFRLLWGVFGSSTARFANFVRGPRKVIAYLSDPAGWRAVGHSPLGALSVLALLGVMLLQVGFGLPLSDEDGIYAGPLNRLVSFDVAEQARAIHESLFTVLQGLVVLHIGAIVMYRLKGKRLVGPMVTGQTAQAPAGAAPMIAAGPGRLLLCLALAGGVTGWIAMGVPGL